MLIAALLFAAGLLEGWRYRAPVVGASSALIGLACLAIWSLTSVIDGEKILVLFAYLSAHQAGYLAGAYISTSIHGDRRE